MNKGGMNMTDEKYEKLMSMDVINLVDYVMGLESMLRDCEDLLNDCGYYFVNDRWVDGDNPDDLEE